MSQMIEKFIPRFIYLPYLLKQSDYLQLLDTIEFYS